MAEISVVIPVYNVESCLRQCVDSVLAQTFRDFQVVLVDDGSTDGSGRICDEYALADKRVHVIHQKNGGLSAARNAGIEWTFRDGRTKWIFFVDSDDAIAPNALEELRHAALEQNVKIAIGGFRPVSEMGKIAAPEVPAFSLVTPHDFWKRGHINRVVAWGKLYDLDLFNGIRYPAGKIHEDELTTPWLLFKVNNLAQTSAPLYLYRQREGSITRSDWTPAHLADVEAERQKAEFFRQSGFPDLADEADLRLLNFLGRAVMRSAKSKDPSYRQYSPRLRTELIAELRRVRSCRKVKVAENYHCFKALYPVLINKVTWSVIKISDFLGFS